MSVLYTIVGSIAGGFVSRLVYSAIDHIDGAKGTGNNTIWWFVLLGIGIMVISIVVWAMHCERCNKCVTNSKKVEAFTMYDAFDDTT